MEQYFYLSFKEFLNNYDKDLKQWLEVYEDGEEEDFILELQNLYKDNAGKIDKVANKGVSVDLFLQDKKVIRIDEVSVRDYGIIMMRKIRDTICKEYDISTHYYDVFLDENNVNPMDYWEPSNRWVKGVKSFENKTKTCEISGYYKSILFDKWTHKTLKNFFNESDYIKSFLYFNEVKYKNFQLSISKILKFLYERMEELGGTETPTKVIDTPTIIPVSEDESLDFSDEKTKVKLIVLEKLGVIDYIKSIQQDEKNVNQTAGILSLIMGCKKDVLYSYIRPMLQGYRDDEDKNSPYKNKKNVTDADKVIHKLKLKPDFDN